MIWELAGIIGVDPGLLTLRELAIMADARSNERWNHTANLMAMIHNVHRMSRRAKTLSPIDIHPKYAGRRKKIVNTPENVAAVKSAFKNWK